jgi:hypothetical protein
VASGPTTPASAAKNEVELNASSANTYTLKSGSNSGKTYTYARASDGTVTRACGTGCTW